jgi:putative methionine-R-sulfoxide reductase with GAF domain
MILVVREPKPACSPLGLHGACGQCWSSGRSLVVTDVANLGAGYVACDPRDRSEVVVPCFDEVGGAVRCWGVLDIDSYDSNAFSVDDAQGLAALLARAGLTAREPADPPRVT